MEELKTNENVQNTKTTGKNLLQINNKIKRM